MKRLIPFIGPLTIALSIAMTAIAEESVPEYIGHCLSDAAQQTLARGGGAKEIKVYSSFSRGPQTYYLARVTSVSDRQWSVAVQFSEGRCLVVGNDYVTEAGLYGDLPEEVVKEWTIQNVNHRLDSVSKKDLKTAIKGSAMQWHSGQIAAFKELGVW